MCLARCGWGGVRRLGVRGWQTCRTARVRDNQRLGIAVPLPAEPASMIKDFQQHKTLRDNYDFCIIGAGPAGITLACAWPPPAGTYYSPKAVDASMRRTRKACTPAHPRAWSCMPRRLACVTWGAPPTTGPAVAGLSPRRILPSPRQVTCPVGRFPIRRSKATCRRPWTSSTCQPARIFVR